MRTTALAAALAALCSPALAGGFSAVAVAPAPVAPVPAPAAPAAGRDWTGFYAGLEAGTLGYGQSYFYEMDGELIEAPYLEGSGRVLGGHVGYQRDFGRLVLGAELAYATADAVIESNAEIFSDDRTFGSVDSLGRAGLRLGFDAGRILPYVAAGVARADVTYAFPEFESINGGALGGRYLGLGVDYAVNDRLTVGIEALRHSFDHEVILMGPADATTTIDTVAIRASWRF